MLPESIAVTLQVAEILERLGVPYLIGGSVASTTHGIMRSTVDVDLLADLRPEHIPPLAAALSGAFYLDTQAIQEALARRSSFNLIHLETMFKVDVFLPHGRAFDQSQMKRRTAQVLTHDPERAAYLASAEDTILAKLDWYRQGGEVSERQWRDVLGVLKVQTGRLDLAYLRQWAMELGVSALLERALEEGLRP